MLIDIPEPLESAFAISPETHAECLAAALAACATGGEVEALRAQIHRSMMATAKRFRAGPMPRRYREGFAACAARYAQLTEMPRP